ncbi:MAG: hypothetical protein KDE35_18390 [Geminicoccaceae bacterium]|nr:hypothetical protein [Geminicoccaceae bacterium]
MAIIRRRTFLAALALLATALHHRRSPAAVAGDPGAGVEGLARGLVAALDRPDAAARMGRRIVALDLLPADAEGLVASLTARHGALGEALPIEGDRRRARHALTRAVRRDFASGRTITVDGWLLARAEAEICVIAASFVPEGGALARARPARDARIWSGA